LREVRGQTVLWENAFSEKLLVHVKAYEDIKEIPKRQRYAGRPALSEILDVGSLKSDEIREAIMEHG
jgi:hypothetical protein